MDSQLFLSFFIPVYSVIACFNLQCIISGREIRETYLMLIAYKLPFFIDAFQLHGILRFIFVLIIEP